MNYLAILQKDKIKRILESEQSEEEKINAIAMVMSDVIEYMSMNIARVRAGHGHLSYNKYENRRENRNRSQT